MIKFDTTNNTHVAVATAVGIAVTSGVIYFFRKRSKNAAASAVVKTFTASALNNQAQAATNAACEGAAAHNQMFGM